MLYRLDELLGHGRTGPVHRGVPDRVGARPVAVRIVCLDDAGVARVRRHAEMVAVIGHAGLGLIEDVTRIDEDRVVVTTTLGTSTLADRLTGVTCSVDEALDVLHAVGSALAAAHHAALPHRSVHAGNVVFSAHAPQRPLLVDLGLGAAIDDEPVTADAWRRDRHDLVTLAQAIVADLSPMSSRVVALRELVVDGGSRLVEDDDGLERLVRECGRIRRRPDMLVTPDVTAVSVAPEPCSPRRQRRRRDGWSSVPTRRHALAAAALAAGVVVGLGMMRHRGELPDLRVAESAVCEAAAATEAIGADVDGLVDRDGDGCADSVSWSSGDAVLVIDDGTTSQRFRVGRPGDQALLGDWDCDGERTVGLYRPTTGETFHFSTWADTGATLEATPGPVVDANAAARVVAVDGCETVTTS